MGGASSVLGAEALSSIRLINFEDFRALKAFPRYPDNKDITKTLNEFDDSFYQETFIVFISHCWLRGWSGAEGWDGRPHPDNAKGEKFELCVEGISLIKQNLAAEMKNCYVWLDYGCIDQDGNPAGELKMLDKIVQVCDCIFTPIVDKDDEDWDFALAITNWYEDYRSSSWKGKPHSYLNRAWCRVEMFYAANIPLLENAHSDQAANADDNRKKLTTSRLSKMSAGLAFHQKEGRRPHYIYGSHEKRRGFSPFALPPLQNAWLDKYNPAKGNLSVEGDREIIKRLMDELSPYIKPLEVGYVGELSAEGEKNGRGRYIYEDGSMYEGDWLDDKRHGVGIFTYPSGDSYAGEWKDDRMHGCGKFFHYDGTVYEGEYKFHSRNGEGILKTSNGDVYVGHFNLDFIDGFGKYTFASGVVYEGEWQKGVRHGIGKVTTPDGECFEGYFQDGAKHGKGKYIYASGNFYDGDWQDNEMTGIGKFVILGENGYEYEGEVLNGLFHGKGKMTYTDGGFFEGEFVEDKMHGPGVLTKAEGVKLEGIWENDEIHGKAKWIYPTGEVSEVEYDHGKKL